jgi:putative regulator of septum formation
MINGRSIVPWAIVAVAVGVAITRGAERGSEGEITDAGSVDAFAMRVGDCFDDWDSVGEVSEVPGVPCGDPHDNQVFAVYDLTMDTWPGDDEIESQSTMGCYDRFEAAIGETYEDSVIDFLPMYPSSGSWKQRNDREVVCIAYHVEYEKLTGTVLGSGM